MKFKLIITEKETGKKQQSDFMSLADAEIHLSEGMNKGWWGQNAYIIHHEEKVIHHEEIPAVEAQAAVLDENEVEITPAIDPVDAVPAYDEVIPAWDESILASYDFEIVDMSADFEAKELKKAKKEAAIVSLQNIDWASINTIAELKAIVKALVEKED